MSELGDFLTLSVFESKSRPVLGVKFHSAGRKKLLQGPSSREPPSIGQICIDGRASNIFKVSEAGCSIAVPREHGVDSFRQLGTATLIDAARIDPTIFQSPLSSLTTCVFDLGICIFGIGF
jgi:hypothetical protein